MVIDQFVMPFVHQLSAYDELSSRVGFLGKLDILDGIELPSEHLVTVYQDELEQSFQNEFVQFLDSLNECLEDAEETIGDEHFRYKLIIDVSFS